MGLSRADSAGVFKELVGEALAAPVSVVVRDAATKAIAAVRLSKLVSLAQMRRVQLPSWLSQLAPSSLPVRSPYRVRASAVPGPSFSPPNLLLM